MHKFKIGDEVQYIGGYYQFRGAVGTVVNFSGAFIKIAIQNDYWYALPSNLILISSSKKNYPYLF